jgi:predicted metal-dependent hydrolase
MEILDKSPPAEVAAWPPEYQLRFSKKAKHVHLKIFPNRGLEIVVPFRQQKRFRIEELLDEKKSWIEKHLATVKIPTLEIITVLKLRAIQQEWQIEYIKTASSQLRHIIVPGTTANILKLYGAVDDIQRTHLWLTKWLKQMAQKHLLPWLKTLSLTHQLPFNRAAVRGQQTLWGSCTSQKNISLNYKLIFIPPKHAEHIMLHELCHTKHLNHSRRFWDLLMKLDPDTELHNKAVREGDKFVPSCFTN